MAAHNCGVELLQPKGQNRYAVFAVKESEAITYSYERNTGDPRITHNLNIKLDEYGNVLESAAVVYPRMMADSTLPAETRQAQDKTTIIYTQNVFTNDVDNDHVYRLRFPSEVKTYELKGVAKAGAYYGVSDFDNILASSAAAAYHQTESDPPPGTSQKRLIEHLRTVYYDKDLAGPLPLHVLEAKGLTFESYQLAYTPALINNIFGTKAGVALMLEGKFTHSEGDDSWWVRSGAVQYIEDGETAVQAGDRFFMPVSYTDPYGAKTRVKYYGGYYLLIEETEDAAGNKVSVDLFNFRTLLPRRMKDANNNFSETITDELGMVKAMALLGKGNEADDLSGLSEVTTAPEQILTADFFNAADTVQLTNLGKDLLQHATTRFVYDFDAYKNSGKPLAAASIMREEHFQTNNDSPVQLSFEYSNGLGQVVMKKEQAEPGLAKQVTVYPDDHYTIAEIDTGAGAPIQLRWTGSGRTILNNKGNPVKQYEPYFSVTHRYEDLKELVETGVTPILYYDAVGRLIKTEMPDGTFSKTEFDAWKQVIFDPNDTVLASAWYHNRVSRLIDAELTAAGKDPGQEKTAAEKAAKHADTPTIRHFDSLGRAVLSVDHNKHPVTEADEFHYTRVELDTEGNLRGVIDARNNMVALYKYDMLGNQVYQNSMDAGQRWLLANILGNPLRAWDERGHEFQYFYDMLHRPAYSKVLGGDGDTPLDHIYDRIFYGEAETDPEQKNLRGRAVKHYDTAGLVETPEYDFKGQPKLTARKLYKKYKTVVNWADANLAPDLEDDSYNFMVETDALGRITRQTAPDGSVITLSYNQAGLLNGQSVVHTDPALTTTYIKDIDYNEKGQRSKIIYGNDVVTRYYYDSETFRLSRLESKRQNNEPLQDWRYTFDPAGNITHIEDKDVPVVFFENEKVTGVSEYTYDALYRLTEATGRENNAALDFNGRDNWNDAPYIHQLNPGDPMAVRNYTQSYLYDPVGNILQMRHQAAGGNWTRSYSYQAANNRLISTQVGANIYIYPHHPRHGFMAAMPHLEDMGWNFKEELVKTIRQRRFDGGVSETTYYQYDGQGQRIRKITENQAGAGFTPTKKDERIYIAGYELYRQHSGTDAGLERVSLSLTDQRHRFVVIETRNDVDDGTEKHLVRYQLHNHLGSAGLELDGTSEAKVISYEEYHPFGTTAYQAKNAAIKCAAKRYRYTGLERDEETGLEYHSARYYLPWLGRWINSDRLGIEAGINLYAYVEGRATVSADPTGMIAWVFVAVVFVVATLTSIGEAGAPRNERDVARLRPSISDEEFVAHTTLTGLSMAAGGGASRVVLERTGSRVLAGMAGGGTVGLTSTPTSMAVSDIARGEMRPPSEYVRRTAMATIGGIGVGGGLGGASRLIRGPAPPPAPRPAPMSAPRPSAGPGATAGARTATAPAADPPGSFRDAAGRLRDARGHFMRDPARTPASRQPAPGPPPGGSAGSMSDVQLAQRAAELHRQLVIAELGERGICPTEALIRRVMGQGTVSVVETQVSGQAIRIVTTTSTQHYRLLSRFLRPGEQLGSGPIPVSGGGGRFAVHAEQIGVNDAVQRGAVQGRVGTSHPGCDVCQSFLDDLFPGFRHVNPAP